MPDVTQTTHEVVRSDAMKKFARLGLFARAVIYLLIGWLAVLISQGKAGKEADQRGALSEVTQHTGGTVLLWVIALGLAAYALWRFGEAIVGPVGDGKKTGARLKSFGRGLIYAFFAVSAFKILLGAKQSSQRSQQQDITANALKSTGGRIVVGIVGAAIIVAGLVLIYEGVTKKFTKYFDANAMSPGVKKLVWTLGTIGTTARGLVFAMSGWLVLQAAIHRSASDSGGIDVALRKLAGTSYGPWLLLVVALGLVCFGIYGLAEAAWRRT